MQGMLTPFPQPGLEKSGEVPGLLEGPMVAELRPRVQPVSVLIDLTQGGLVRTDIEQSWLSRPWL